VDPAVAGSSPVGHPAKPLRVAACSFDQSSPHTAHALTPDRFASIPLQHCDPGGQLLCSPGALHCGWQTPTVGLSACTLRQTFWPFGPMSHWESAVHSDLDWQ